MDEKLLSIQNYIKLPLVIMLITFLLKLSGIGNFIIPNYIILHTFIELLSVSIGFMMFILFWGIRLKNITNLGLIISFSFLTVSIVDLFHIVTYSGMPNFFSINSLNTTIYFWIVSRSVQTISLFFVCLWPRKTIEHRNAITYTVLATMIISASLVFIGIYDHRLPIFFDANIGMTNSKIILEITFSIISLISGYIFLKRSAHNYSMFSKSCALFFCMGIVFTLYQRPNDLMNLWGHIIKTIGYIQIYLNLVYFKLIEPYEKIEKINCELQSKIENIKSLESEIERSRKIASLGSEVRGMAHDLNNVLMIISNSANSILKINEIKDNEQLQNKVKQIKKATNRSHDFLKSLLKFSKNVSTEKEDIQLHAVFYDFEKNITPLIPKNITLNFSSPIEHTISFPKTDLEQILFNLIVNARDAIEDRQGEIKIKSTKKTIDKRLDFLHYHIPEGEYICISIEDNGCGIEEKILASIFEPFFTTKGDGKGSGIGLATVISIMQKNHSYILVESKLNQGSKFELYFSTTNLDQVIEFNEITYDSDRRVV